MRAEEEDKRQLSESSSQPEDTSSRANFQIELVVREREEVQERPYTQEHHIPALDQGEN